MQNKRSVEWILFLMIWIIGSTIYFYVPGFNIIHMFIGAVTMILSLTIPYLITDKFAESTLDAVEAKS